MTYTPSRSSGWAGSSSAVAAARSARSSTTGRARWPPVPLHAGASGALTELTAWTFSCRADFEQLQRVDPSTLTDLQRAARFIQLQKLAFGGKVRGRSFGVRTDGPARWRSGQVTEDLLAAAARLEAVTIENLDWSVFLARYDRPRALFYLDPPYFGCEGDYGDGFGREQFTAMADQLAAMKGRFILSLNDRPEVREIFGAFDIEGVGTHYGLAGRGAAAAREVIITGGG